ncbi:MAG: outer membrane lipoprotein-sorting protein [Hyphomicrobiales bacterium]
MIRHRAPCGARSRRAPLSFGLALAAALAAAACGAAPRAATGAPAAPSDSLPDGRAVMERMTDAMYYPGRDVVSDVRMEIVERSGLVRLRVMTMMRLNLEKGEQRYLVYFHEPGDVRRMTCMVYKHPAGRDDRWMFVPAVEEIRRVTAPERSKFLGSDFVREDYSGRDAAADSHRVVRGEVRDGRSCWVVESTPIEEAEYTRLVSWIDRKTWLPIRQEYYDARGRLMRTFTADSIATILDPEGHGHPTIVAKTMAGRTPPIKTRMIYTDVRYDVGLKESDFSDDHLRVSMDSWYRPPRR